MLIQHISYFPYFPFIKLKISYSNTVCKLSADEAYV